MIKNFKRVFAGDYGVKMTPRMLGNLMLARMATL